MNTLRNATVSLAQESPVVNPLFIDTCIFKTVWAHSHHLVEVVVVIVLLTRRCICVVDPWAGHARMLEGKCIHCVLVLGSRGCEHWAC